MPACEKCWRDSRIDALFGGGEGAYERLVESRKDNPCTPEEQAGRDARWCIPCERQTCHELCDICMICGRTGGIGGRLEDFQ